MAAEFDQIVVSGHGDEDQAALAENPFELSGVHPGVDGGHEVEALVGVRQEAVGVGHYEEDFGRRLRRHLDGGRGDVDAVALEAGDPRGVTKECPLAAADIQKGGRASLRS